MLFLLPQVALDIKLLYEHLIWFYPNKKSLEKGLKAEQKCKKAIEEKAAKEAKTIEGLKKQLREKMASMKEKN